MTLQLSEKNNFNSLKSELKITLQDSLLLKIAKNTKSVECNFEEAINEILSCNSNFYIEDNLDEFEVKLLLQFHPDRNADNPAYMIPDKDNLFKSQSQGVVLDGINVARERILKIIRAFVQSGIKSNMLENENFQSNLIALRKARLRYGKLEDGSNIKKIIKYEFKCVLRIYFVFASSRFCIYFFVIEEFIINTARTFFRFYRFNAGNFMCHTCRMLPR